VTDAPFSIVALAAHHVRSGFSCGNAALDSYLQTHASQDVKRKVATCFVAIENATGQIAGYYTLSACHVYLSGLDEETRRKLPKYPTVPAVRLGRLAIDTRFQGRKLGAAMLGNAAARAIRSEIATAMMVVDAKDEKAAAFYLHNGFRRDPMQPLKFYAELGRMAELLGIE
jgi:ribosomal protein S18 acetylase RimI-like enzyme